MDKNVYIVLGNGVAGVSAAKAIRQNDESSKVIMISSEDVVAYSRPMLTKTPLNSYDLDKTLLYPQSWYDDNGIDLILSTTVNEIDREKKIIHTTNGEYEYDKCIYALGANNFSPPIKGIYGENIVSIRTYKDIQQMKELALGATDAVVIGAGVIGIETAIELSKQNVNVTILEACPSIMPRNIDVETSNKLMEVLEPIKVLTACKIKEIITADDSICISLESGINIKADFLVVSTGVRANIELAQNAGLICSRSLVVNEFMQTSDENVYACGDCAEYDGMNYSLWEQARVQGEIAGANAAGKSLKYGTVDTSVLLNSPKFSLFAAGDTGNSDCTDYDIEICDNNETDNMFYINKNREYSFKKKWSVEGRLVGAVQLGNLMEVQSLKNEIFKEQESYDESK
jgi:NAD(P)H-nitrite reductase large subunit